MSSDQVRPLRRERRAAALAQRRAAPRPAARQPRRVGIGLVSALALVAGLLIVAAILVVGGVRSPRRRPSSAPRPPQAFRFPGGSSATPRRRSRSTSTRTSNARRACAGARTCSRASSATSSLPGRRGSRSTGSRSSARSRRTPRARPGPPSSRAASGTCGRRSTPTRACGRTVARSAASASSRWRTAWGSTWRGSRRTWTPPGPAAFVADGIADATRAGVNSTPTVVVNGTVVVGGYTELAAGIAAAAGR